MGWYREISHSTPIPVGRTLKTPISYHTGPFRGVLQSHIKKRLPLLQMRKKTIPLRSKKMITAAENRKKSNISIDKIFTEDLIFFDLKHVFQTFFSSNYRQKMHIEMIEFHDSFSELWHFHN